jgi:AmiR/NasT family two-component response regulator
MDTKAGSARATCVDACANADGVAGSMNVALCLADRTQPELQAALQMAGHRVQRFAAQSLPHIGAMLPAPDVAIIDCEAIADRATTQAVTELSQSIPLVLLTTDSAAGQGTLKDGLRAVALLQHPIQAASLLASLPLWVRRHRESVALRMAEADLLAALLSSRRISSAVGMLAERHSISVDEAFNRLRSQARANRQRTEELAQHIVSGQGNTR